MRDYGDIVGFNYHPSYAWNSYETWRLFDAGVIEREIALGKRYFPKMNTVRLWLSYDAFRYEEDRQAENFETALRICAKYGLKTVVCLFNCWHDSVMDNGGIYHPQMIDGSVWSAVQDRFDSYFEKIVGRHADDDRILIWDICNEPYSYGGNREYREFMEPHETAWLRRMADMCREAGAKQPRGISAYASSKDPGSEWIEKTADFTDILLVHPYYYYSDDDVRNLPPEGFDRLLERCRELSRKYGKPVLTTETCWGSGSDRVRAEIVERTLTAHKKARIGYLAHALHWSHVADLHGEGDGPYGGPGNLAFITKDGRIREGHEVFNRF